MKVVVRFVCLFVLMVLLTACGAVQEEKQSTSSSVQPTISTGNVQTTPNVHQGKKPIRLRIPSISVNAQVEEVGILANGDMGVPEQNQWENVGWYSSGTYPGEQGSAVIDGHLDRPGGDPAVFWRLRDVKEGDWVELENEGGKTLRFRVTRVALYTPGEAPLQDIFANRQHQSLNLITCAGDWIPSEKQTTLRLVVYTVLDG